MEKEKALRDAVLPLFPDGSTVERASIEYLTSRTHSYGIYEEKPNGRARLVVEISLPQKIDVFAARETPDA